MEILERVDAAQLAGLMPDAPSALPAWFSTELQEELIDTMVSPARWYTAGGQWSILSRRCHRSRLSNCS